jgi:hypothetical protein
MDQVLALFELPAYFHEVSGQKALVESFADGNKLPQGLDFLSLKADEQGGLVFLFHRESPLGIMEQPSGFGKGMDPLLIAFWIIFPFIGNRPIHCIRDVIQGLILSRSCQSLRLSTGGPSTYYPSASGLRFFNQEKLSKMIKGPSGLADKNIKRRRPRKVGKGGMAKADPTGNLP